MIKAGDIVEVITNSFATSAPKGTQGVVTEVLPGDPENPIEDHGFIEVLIGGQETHWVHINWQDFLKIVN